MNDFEGLVIRKTDINEADAMLCVLTNHGKRSFKVKGVNKLHSKNAYGCQLFSQSFFHLLDMGRSLKNVEVIDSFKNIREDLLKQSAASLFMEAADKYDLFTYDEMIDCLKALNQYNSNIVVCFFIAQLMIRNGIGLIVDECVYCGHTKGIKALSLNDGGFICSDCFDPYKHLSCNLEQLKYIRRLFKAEWRHFDLMMKESFDDALCLKILLKCYENHGDIPLNSIEFYLNVIHLFKFDKSL